MYREEKDEQMNQASGTKHQAKGGPADPVAWHAPRLYLQGPTPVYFLVSRQKVTLATSKASGPTSSNLYLSTSSSFP